MRRGLLWSHLLASILGGLVLAAVLLGFGVIGKQRTETVPINLSAPQTQAGGTTGDSNLQGIYGTASPGVVQINTMIRRAVSSPFVPGGESPGNTATSSGFLISRSQGLILTTFHGILGADNQHPGITVIFDNDVSRSAEVVDESEPDDIALLKVSMRGIPSQIQALTIGNSQSISVGATVLSIANPFGLERTLASGIVSALQRRLDGINGSMVDNVIQTDIAASPRADGGPLLDSAGEVVGINSQIQVQTGASVSSVGFATPIDSARKIIPKGVLP